MHLTPEDLPAHGFVLLDRLDHQQLVPFVNQYLRKRTGYALFYYATNVVVLALLAYLVAVGWGQPGYALGERLAWAGSGFALSFGLMPLHEYLHVLAYRALGARHTSYAANLRKFYFMALADRFVASRREFAVVALTPFGVISAGLLLLLPLVPPAWAVTLAGVLLAHTAMCSGDFGLLSYFQYHRAQEVVTYDDLATRTSYFLGRPPAASPPTA